MKRPRVLMVGPLPPPFGGIATLVNNLLHSSIKENVDLVHLNTAYDRLLEETGKFNLSNIKFAFRQYFEFIFFLLWKMPDIVHIHTSFSISFLKNSVLAILAKLVLRKVIIHFHCDYSKFYKEKAYLYKLLIRFLLIFPDRLIVLSKDWLNLSKAVRGEKILLIPNSIDVRPFLQNPAKTEIKSASFKKIKVLYMGSIGELKGSFDLIEAIRIIANKASQLHFFIVGEAMGKGEKDKSIQMCNHYKIENLCTFVGAVYGEKKKYYLMNSDIVVSPSHAEGLPIVLLEALAAGLPIVATKVGGIPDIVADGINGFLVEPRSPESLAEKILLLASDPDLRERINRNNVQKAVKLFDIEHTAWKIVREYNRLLGQNKRGVETN